MSIPISKKIFLFLQDYDRWETKNIKKSNWSRSLRGSLITTKSSKTSLLPHENSIINRFFRQSIIKYSFKFGVSANVRRFHVFRVRLSPARPLQRQIRIPAWQISHPHSPPDPHTPAELARIRDMYKRNSPSVSLSLGSNSNDAVIPAPFPSLWRILHKLLLPVPKYIPTLYIKMFYPGQRVQFDVKIVPLASIAPNADGLQTNPPPLMGIPASVSLPPLKSTAPVLPFCSWIWSYVLSLSPSHVFGRTTDWSSKGTKKENCRCFRHASNNRE